MAIVEMTGVVSDCSGPVSGLCALPHASSELKQCRLCALVIGNVAVQGAACVRPMNPYKMARLLRPTLGMLANSKASAEWRSSTLRKPAFAKARAAPSGRPLRSQAFDASQYSSNDEGLRLMSDNSPPICVGS